MAAIEVKIPEQVQPYQYDALPDKAIRLLEVPESMDKPWILKIHGIQNAPPYVAFSYTWGPPIATSECEAKYGDARRDILVAKGDHVGRLQIGLNLWDGLRQSMESVIKVGLWVDAICINQDDIQERSCQVAMMDKIFSQCGSLLVWLGKDHVCLEDFCWFHETLLEHLHEWENEERSEVLTMRASVWRLVHKTGDDLYKRWHGYILFYEQCRWFHRCWVLQEVALAPDIMIFCGSKHIDWDDVEAISRLLNDHGPSIIPPSGWKPEGAETDLAAGHKVHKIAQQRGRCLKASLQLDDNAFAITGPENPMQLYLAFLLFTLSAACGFQASDPRDKIYASLGMAANFLPPGHDPLAVPDYTSSVVELYRHVAALFIRKLPYLGCLSYVQDPSQRKRDDLPSWVPDFSSPSINTAYAFRYNDFPHNACPVRDLSPHPRAVVDCLLRVYGVAFDKVTVVDWTTEYCLPHDNGFLSNSPGHILCFLDGLMEFIFAMDYQYVNGQGRLEALARTLILNQVDQGAPPDDPAACFCAWLSHNMRSRIEDLKKADPEYDPVIIERSPLMNDGTNTKSFQKRQKEGPIKSLEQQQKRSSLAAICKERRRAAFLGEESFREILSYTRSVDEDNYKKEMLWPEDFSDQELRERLQKTGDHRSSYSFTVRHEMYQRALDSAFFLRQRLYKTSKGYTGLGPPSMSVGDQVTFICDSKVPFILRPSYDDQFYRLIGETYLHGFMNGEVLEAGFDDRIKPIHIV